MPEKSDRNGLEIAIIGMSGRFPGASNLHEFWENLKNESYSISFFTQGELLQNSNINPDEIKQPNFVKAKGIIDNIEYFDTAFFGYSPGEAELLDPQIRFFYEICWEALEDAAYDPSTYNGSIGVYAGGSANFSWELLMTVSREQEITGQFSPKTLTNKDYLSTRISYRLDLKGLAVTIDTACSTVLVGTDLACRGLLTGQCDAALVGGVCVMAESARGGGYLYQEGFVRSPDGSVRTFDTQAQGVVFSHSGGSVLLKRLDDALNTAFNTNKKQYCALGSVKTNIGHLDGAAGAAGLIKVVLMLKHREIPPSLNYETT